MNLGILFRDLGLYPTHPLSLYYPLGVLGLWLLFLPFAYLRRITIFYNSSLKAAFGEEIIYRGIVYGTVMYLLHNELYALVISSLVFGLAHMGNLWWAGWRRAWHTTVHAGFRAGPVFGLVRWLSGDIYLGIAVHFLHNLFVMFPPPGFSHRMARTPTNEELRSKSGLED